MRILAVQSFHDSSVVVLNDGNIECFHKEERYTKVKRDFNPFKSISLALEHAGGNIDHICIDSNNTSIPSYIQKHCSAPITFYKERHHLCHASLAFFNSGFSEALVFVIDREGSFNDSMIETETVFKAGYPCEFKTLHKNYWLFNKGTDFDVRNNQNIRTIVDGATYNADSTMSISKVYETANTLISQTQFESGKTMGLAAYGKDQEFDSFFYKDIPIDGLFTQDIFPTSKDGKIAPIYRKYYSKITDNVTKENYQFYADYAYQVQKQTQEQVLQLVKRWVDKTGIRKVCLSGGYAMNVVTNGYLVKNLPNVEFYFEPLADDTGNSIGMAMHMYRYLTKDSLVRKLKTTCIHGRKDSIDVVGEPCGISDIVKLLNEQKVVAVFNGLSESGQRALGNRSILFDARNPKAKEIVNEVKHREWYRPFAGMVLKESFKEYFDTYGLDESPYMTISFPCISDSIPGVTHVDGSCRVQTVDESIPHLYELLKEFGGVLLNTSFNLAGQPLVETIDDAILTFNNSKIDALWIPELNVIIRK